MPNSPWREQSEPLRRCWPCLAAGGCCCPSPGRDGAGFRGRAALAAHPGLLWPRFPGWQGLDVCCSSSRSLDGTTLELLKGSLALFPGFSLSVAPLSTRSLLLLGVSDFPSVVLRSFAELPHVRAEHPLHGFCSPWAGWVRWVAPKPCSTGLTAVQNHPW